jgi:hypothetical protein
MWPVRRGEVSPRPPLRRGGGSADTGADTAFAAGEGVAAGVDLHLQAAAALPDHLASQPSRFLKEE